MRAEEWATGGGALHTRVHCIPGAIASAWVVVAAGEGSSKGGAEQLADACAALAVEGARALGGAAALPIDGGGPALQVRVFFVPGGGVRGLSCGTVEAAVASALRSGGGEGGASVAALPVAALPPCGDGGEALLLAHFLAVCDGVWRGSA